MLKRALSTSVVKRVFCQHFLHDYPHHAQHHDHHHHDQQHPPHFLHRDVIISPPIPSPIIRFAFQYTALRRVIFDLLNMSSSSSSSFITASKEIITTNYRSLGVSRLPGISTREPLCLKRSQHLISCF